MPSRPFQVDAADRKTLDERCIHRLIYTMVRTQIYLTEAERQGVAALARATNRTQSQIIRHALDLYLGLSENNAAEQRRAAFGIWRKRKIDGVQLQRKLRGEWER